MIAVKAGHKPVNVPDIVGSTQKIEDLLGSHLIPLHATDQSGVIMICHLRDANKNMETTVHRVEMARAKIPVP